MCRFCRDVIPLPNVVQMDTHCDEHDVAWLDKDGYLVLRKTCAEYEIDFKMDIPFKFCPYCGRQLRSSCTGSDIVRAGVVQNGLP